MAAIARSVAEVAHMRYPHFDNKRYDTSWFGERPQKGDVSFAKNYLNEDETRDLNLIVSANLDFAELQGISRKPIYMADWICKFGDFIRMSDREILTHAGTMSQSALSENLPENLKGSLPTVEEIEAELGAGGAR